SLLHRNKVRSMFSTLGGQYLLRVGDASSPLPLAVRMKRRGERFGWSDGWLARERLRDHRLYDALRPAGRSWQQYVLGRGGVPARPALLMGVQNCALMVPF